MKASGTGVRDLWGWGVSGEAVRDIVDYARTTIGDLIIITTHRTKGLGSVARSAVKHAPCPALVMHPFKGSPEENSCCCAPLPLITTVR